MRNEISRRVLLNRALFSAGAALAAGTGFRAFAGGTVLRLDHQDGNFVPMAVCPTVTLRPYLKKAVIANGGGGWWEPAPPPNVNITSNNQKTRVQVWSNGNYPYPMAGVRCWLDKRRADTTDDFYPYDSAHTDANGYAYFLPIYLSPNVTWEFRYWAEGSVAVKRLVRV